MLCRIFTSTFFLTCTLVFPEEPSPSEFIDFLRSFFPDTPCFVEQMARLSLSLGYIARNSGETVRAIGGGVLLIGKRAVRFPYAYAVTPREVSWEELHATCSARVSDFPHQNFPPVVAVEHLVAFEFLYDSRFTLPLPNGRVLAYCLAQVESGPYQPIVLDMPAFLAVSFPSLAMISSGAKQ